MEANRLYAKAAVLGMVESGNKEDAFHQLIYGMTGKSSVLDLSENEKASIDRELSRRLNSLGKNAYEETPAGMMTIQQQKYAWRLMYTLESISPSKANRGQRMAGIVRKTLGISAHEDHPFIWVDQKGGSVLIDTLKRYVRNAHRKKGAMGDESG